MRLRFVAKSRSVCCAGRKCCIFILGEFVPSLRYMKLIPVTINHSENCPASVQRCTTCYTCCVDAIGLHKTTLATKRDAGCGRGRMHLRCSPSRRWSSVAIGTVESTLTMQCKPNSTRFLKTKPTPMRDNLPLSTKCANKLSKLRRTPGAMVTSGPWSNCFHARTMASAWQRSACLKW